MRFAKAGDTVSNEHTSTLGEWHQAATSNLTTNRASKEINRGRDPYLMDSDAEEFGMYPFVDIIGIMAGKSGPQADQIAVELVNGIIPLPCDTLVVWR